MSDVGKRIREARESRGLSQYRLAKLSGVAQPTINSIEKEGETRSPSFDTVQRIAAGLRCTVAELAGENVNGEILNQNEERLLSIFRQLNDKGQQFLLSSAEMYFSESSLRQEGSVGMAK
jgi:transcriptional regulator with XRE-family HTH domain